MSQMSEQDFVATLLDYVPGSFEEGFYACKSAGTVDSASQQASQMRVARPGPPYHGQPDRTPYYIVFSNRQNKYVAIVNNVHNGKFDHNFALLEQDVARARALSQPQRQPGEAAEPGQGAQVSPQVSPQVPSSSFVIGLHAYTGLFLTLHGRK